MRRLLAPRAAPERFGDAAVVHRQAAVVQDRVQARAAGCCVSASSSVLSCASRFCSTTNTLLVLLEELPHLLAERERADAAVVGVDALRGQPVERFVDGGIAAADRDDAERGALCASGESRAPARASPPSATSSRADRRLAGTPRRPRCSRRTGCGPSRARNTRRAGARPAACAAGCRRRRRRGSGGTPSLPRAARPTAPCRDRGGTRGPSRARGTSSRSCRCRGPTSR